MIVVFAFTDMEIKYSHSRILKIYIWSIANTYILRSPSFNLNFWFHMSQTWAQYYAIYLHLVQDMYA